MAYFRKGQPIEVRRKVNGYNSNERNLRYPYVYYPAKAGKRIYDVFDGEMYKVYYDDKTFDRGKQGLFHRSSKIRAIFSRKLEIKLWHRLLKQQYPTVANLALANLVRSKSRKLK